MLINLVCGFLPCTWRRWDKPNCVFPDENPQETSSLMLVSEILSLLKESSCSKESMLRFRKYAIFLHNKDQQRFQSYRVSGWIPHRYRRNTICCFYRYNTNIRCSNKDVNAGFIQIWKQPIHINNHLYPSPAKTWSSTSSLMIPRSNGRTEMRKLRTINNSTKSRPIDINIIPDWNQYCHVKNYFNIHNRRVNWRIKSNFNTKDPNLLIHQPYWMNINCTNHKWTFVVSMFLAYYAWPETSSTKVTHRTHRTGNDARATMATATPTTTWPPSKPRPQATVSAQP